MCLYPKLINNPKYRSTKKNGGVIPPIIDERVKLVPIGCGNCKECRKQYARGWQIRLLEDIKTNKNGKFITLTFKDESIKQLSEEIKDIDGYEMDNEIATLAVRRFLERWRKKYKISVRHWLVTEIGHNGTENIHLHGIIWTNETFETIEQMWQYGHIWPNKENYKKNYVNAKTVNYIIKYLTKRDEKHKTYKSKILTSPGIGANYTTTYNYTRNEYQGTRTIENYTTSTGHKISLPIYWRNKRYTEQEREKLWLNKLDKEERWVNGVKIDISKGDAKYWEVLKTAQAENKALGYGDDTKDWQKQQYEKNKRNLMRQTRIKKAEEKIQRESLRR